MALTALIREYKFLEGPDTEKVATANTIIVQIKTFMAVLYYFLAITNQFGCNFVPHKWSLLGSGEETIK